MPTLQSLLFMGNLGSYYICNFLSRIYIMTLRVHVFCIFRHMVVNKNNDERGSIYPIPEQIGKFVYTPL